MRFLVGMETSGAVRDEFISRGHEAVSVDLLPAQNGGPHHEGDLFDYLSDARGGDFDGAVFHPTCTYHTGSAAWAFNDPDYARYPGVGYHMRVKEVTLTGAARRKARMMAEDDVMIIRHLPFPKVIENPVGTLSQSRNLGAPSQIVQPYQFGSDASKATCLWFFDEKGSPILGAGLPIDPAQYVPPRMANGKPRWGNQTDGGQNKLPPSESRWQVRSDTYPGIAAALAKEMIRICSQ